MTVKVSLLLAFLCFLICFSVSEHIDHVNRSMTVENIRSNPGVFVLINPRQVHYLEAAIRRFLAKVAVPINKPIVLKSSSVDSKDLQLTVREICESVRKKLMEFAKDFGLFNTVQQFENSLTNIPLSEDWYSEMMLQNAYMIRDLGNMINEIGSSMHRHLGQKNLILQKNEQLTRQSNGFKFLGVVHNAADFSESLTQCLQQLSNTRKHESPFNLRRRIINLIKDPPHIVLKSLKINTYKMSNSSTVKSYKWSKPLHTLICLSLINNEEISYDDCVRDLKNLRECMKSIKEKSKNQTGDIDERSWMKAIQCLGDCEIQTDKKGMEDVYCKTVRRFPKSIEQKTKHILEKALGKKILKRSPFHRLANDLGETLSMSKWGQQFVDELFYYTSILDDGKIKLQRFTMFKDKDKEARSRYKEVSTALKTYKKGMLRRTFRSIEKMHRSMTDFEKFLAQGMKVTFNEAWQGHLNVLSSMMNWMTKLLEFYTNENGQEEKSNEATTEESDEDENTNSENSEDLRTAVRPRSALAKDVDKSMNELIVSMNRLSKQRSGNEKSTLSCIANNLLLVTILMETIGFVSSLFCFGQNGMEQNSLLHYDDEWKRARRSVLHIEEAEIIDLISSEYFVPDFQGNSSTLLQTQHI